MISFQNIHKKFGRQTVLHDLSLDLKPFSSYAMIGPNGSGKTTLIKCLLGMVVPTSGDILFDGRSILHEWKYRSGIGYMPQIGRYPDNMTIGQLIEMMKNIRQDQEKFDEELIDSFKLYKLYRKRMHTLSGGTRQKVSAALAFLFNPRVLILDEPTAGLDPVSVEILKEKMMMEKGKGKLLLITSHVLQDLDEITTDIVYLFEGAIQYNNTLDALREETRETRLGKAIATMIRQKELVSSITDLS